MSQGNLQPESLKVSVIVPTRNRKEKLNRCIASILNSTPQPFEVIVVDDASDYDVAGDLSAQPVKVIRNDKRRLLAYSRNAGASASSGDLLFFVDDDNVVDPEAVAALAGTFLGSEGLTVCSPLIYYLGDPDAVWTSSIRKGLLPGFYVLDVTAPATATETFSFHDAFVVRKSDFWELGGFDDVDFPIHFSELDFAYRVSRAGKRAVVNPNARVWHDVVKGHMNVDSTRAYYTLRNRIILMKRYERRRNYLIYACCILPFLTGYYLVHHLLYASDHRLLAASNLVKGAFAGLTYKRSAAMPR